MKDVAQNMRATARAGEIFFEALECETEDEQKAFIKNACADDAGLKQEVDLLFESRTQAEDFFEDEALMEISAQDLLNALANLRKPEPEHFKGTNEHQQRPPSA